MYEWHMYLYISTKKKSCNKSNTVVVFDQHNHHLDFLSSLFSFFYFSWITSYIVSVQEKIAFGFIYRIINQTRMKRPS